MEAVEHLRHLLGNAKAIINAKRIHYATGQHFLNHAAVLRSFAHNDQRDDVEQ